MRKIIVAILLVTMIGCSTHIKDLQHIQDTIYEVSSGNIIYDIKSVELSSNDSLIIDHSFNKLNSFISRWKEIPKEDFSVFLSEYNDVRKSYLDIHKIVSSNWDLYSDTNKEKLLKYKSEAVMLDSSVKRMVRIKNYYKAAKIAISVAKVAAGALK